MSLDLARVHTWLGIGVAGSWAIAHIQLFFFHFGYNSTAIPSCKIIGCIRDQYKSRMSNKTSTLLYYFLSGVNQNRILGMFVVDEYGWIYGCLCRIWYAFYVISRRLLNLLFKEKTASNELLCSALTLHSLVY